MARRPFDVSKYKKQLGILYRNVGTASDPIWDRATPIEIKRYEKAMSSADTPQRTIRAKKMQPQFNKYFGSSTRLREANNRLAKWAGPLSLRGGKDPIYNFERALFEDGGEIRKDSDSRRWGANLNNLNRKDMDKPGTGISAILNGAREWIRQIQISKHQLSINAEYFRIAVGYRAQKVFQDSFKYQKFWASGSQPWAPLSTFTKKKRAKRGTGTRILKEYGDLYESIKMDENASKGLTRIYTDIVKANPEHHKKHSICYAGYHNDPRPGDTYGNGWGKRRPKQYIRRQFMGHSDKIDSFAARIMKRYLFDSVFLIKMA